MNSEQSKQIFDLIKKTRDKLVVLDQDGSSFVIMDLKEYEKLLLATSEVKDLTENELLDKINRDIAIWKANQSEEAELDKIANYDKMEKTQDELISPEVSAKEERFYIEPEM
jgi:PHD/YefM family antitoxin component YafN of YafNO toxin-antitoxin module